MHHELIESMESNSVEVLNQLNQSSVKVQNNWCDWGVQVLDNCQSSEVVPHTNQQLLPFCVELCPAQQTMTGGCGEPLLTSCATFLA